MKRYLLILIIFSFSLLANDIIEWEKNFNSDASEILYSIINTTDDNFLAVGNSDPSGVTQEKIWVIKFDKDGNIYWNKTFGETSAVHYSSVNGVIKTSDNGFAIVGKTNENYSTNKTDLLFLKLDSSGNMEWKKVLGGDDFDEAKAVIQTSDGGYLILSYTLENSKGKIWVFKISSNGTLEWTKTFGSEKEERVESVIETSNGEYIISSYIYDDNSIWLLKIDSSGNLLLEKTINEYDRNFPNKIIKTEDGFILLNYIYSKNVYMLKFDDNFNLKWKKTLDFSYAYLLDSIENGNFVVHGYKYNTTTSSKDFKILIFDKSGNLVGEKEILDFTSNEIASSFHTSDNSVIVLENNYTDSSGRDSYILKTKKIDIDPTLIISSNKIYISINEIVDFNASAVDGDGYITGYLWDFGDGTTSGEQNPSHSYTTIGTYEVNCTITDNDGFQSSKTLTISVTDSSNLYVEHNLTGLIWEDTSETLIAKTWGEANSYCENLTLGGYSDWRMPSEGELASLIDFNKTTPSVHPIFNNIVNNYYFSSTEDSSNYYFTVFMNGVVKTANIYQASYYNRCVRGSIIRKQSPTIPYFEILEHNEKLSQTINIYFRTLDVDSTNLTHKIEFGDGNQSIITNTTISQNIFHSLQNLFYKYSNEGNYSVKLTVTDDDSLSFSKTITTLTTPNSPSELKVLEVNATSVTLGWKDNSNMEDGFNIENEALDINYTMIANTTTYTINNLTPNTSYDFNLSAFNSKGSSIFQSITFTTLSDGSNETDTIPNRPSYLTGSNIGGSDLELNWGDASNNENGFKIYQDGVLIATTTENVTKYVVENLTLHKLYDFNVSAFNNIGESNGQYREIYIDNNLSILHEYYAALDNTDLNSLNMETGIAGTYYDGTKGGWYVIQPKEYITFYKIPYWGDKKTFTIGTDINVYTTSGSESNRPQILGSVKIENINIKNSGILWYAGRNYYEITNRSLNDTIPNQPSIIYASSFSLNKLKMEWNDLSDNEDGFKLYQDGVLISTLGTGVTTYEVTIDDTTTYKLYDFNVTAYNSVGESNSANRVVFVKDDFYINLSDYFAAKDDTDLNKLNLKTGIASTYHPSNETDWFISQPKGYITFYKIPYWGTKKTFAIGSKVGVYTASSSESNRPEIIGSVSLDDIDIKDTGVVWYANRHYYSITNLNADGEVDNNDTKPLPPTELNATNIQKSSLTLNWKDNSNNESGFKIYKNGSLLVTLNVNTTTYNVTNLTQNTMYDFNVTAFNNYGESNTTSLRVKTKEEVVYVPQIPTPPSDLNATVIDLDVTLRWKDNSDNESGFKIYKDGALIGTIGSNSTLYMIKGLDENRTYTFEVKAYNNDGESISTKVLVNTYAKVPPKVTIVGTIPKEPNRGESINIRLIVEDLNKKGLKEATLEYKDTKSDEWQSIKISNIISGEEFNLTIPSNYTSSVKGAGIECFVKVTDNIGLETITSTKFIKLNKSQSEKFDMMIIYQKDEPNSCNIKAKVIGFKNSELLSFNIYKLKGDSIDSSTKEVIDSSLYYLNGEGTFVFELPTDYIKGTSSIILEAKTDEGDFAKSEKVYCVSKDEDSIKEFIQERADTVILTNFSKMTNAESLKTTLKELVKTTWEIDENGMVNAKDNSRYNMLPIVIDLSNQKVLDGDLELFQHTLDSSLKDSSAEEIVLALNESLKEYKVKSLNEMYLVIAGSHKSIPFGQFTSSLTNWGEGTWANKIKAFDSSYASLYGNSKDKFPSDSIYRSYFKTGRLVENTNEIAIKLKSFIDKSGYVLTTKNILYFGGYDHNNPAIGFNSIKTIDSEIKNYSAWSADGSIYNPEGFRAVEMVESINGDTSSIINYVGHSDYDYISPTKSSYIGWLFNRNINFADSVFDINDLSNSIFMTNGCHVGVNFSYSLTSYELNGKYADFPEALSLINLPLAIYIAPTSYGVYSNKKIAYSDLIHYNATHTLLSQNSEFVIVNAFYDKNNLPYSEDTIKDLLARQQFYGIPNYRVGPQSEQLASLGFRNLKTRAVTLSDEDNSFFTKSIDRVNNQVEVNFEFKLGSNYSFNDKDGSLKVQTIDNFDENERPVISFRVPIAINSIVSKVEILNQNYSNELSYGEEIAQEFANSEGVYSFKLVSENYEDLEVVSANIIDGELVVNVSPIQYKTPSKKAKITTSLKAKVLIDLPVDIVDSDGDGMPDYWEKIYGLNPTKFKDEDGAEADIDGDGYSNIEEYLNFTNPLMVDDMPKPNAPTIANIEVVENGAKITYGVDMNAKTIQAFYGEDKDKLFDSSLKVAIDGEINLANLKANTKYYIVLRTFNGLGEMSEASNISEFITPKGMPPAIATDLYFEGDSLIIQNPSDEDLYGFNIYFSKDGNFSESEMTFIKAGEDSSKLENISELTKGIGVKEVYIKVNSVDENFNESGDSKILTYEVKLEDSKVITLTKGWNLISLPVDKSLNDLSEFGFIKANYKFKDGKWIVDSQTLDKEEGIWLEMSNFNQVEFQGEDYTPNFENLTEGWHLMGSGTLLENPSKDNSIIELWTFENSKWHKNPEVIYSGEGFWVKK